MYIVPTEDIIQEITKLKLKKAKLEIAYYTSVLEGIKISPQVANNITREINKNLKDSEQLTLDILSSANKHETESELHELVETVVALERLLDKINE